MYKTSVLPAVIAVLTLAVSFTAQAQTIAAAPSESVLPPPMSITQRYEPSQEPPKAPRAALTLLVDDVSTVVAAAGEVASVPQPVVVEEVGARPAIAALARGRLAITVSGPQQR